MSQTLTETSDHIVITHHHPRALRIVVGLASLLPLYGFYEMLLKPRWNLSNITLGNFWLLIVPLVIGIGCMSLTLTLLTAVVFGPDETFVFDKRHRQLIYKAARRPFTPAQERRIRFADLPLPQVMLDDSGDGPDRWDVRLHIPGLPQPHTLYYYTGKEEAEALCARLLAPSH